MLEHKNRGCAENREAKPRVAFASHVCYFDTYNEANVAGCLSILDYSWPGRPGGGTVAGGKTVDPEIKIGHLNDRGYSLRPSNLQLTVRLLILAAWIAGLDAAAINWTIMAREIDLRAGTGGGSRTAHWSVHDRPDGSVVRVVRNFVTGSSTTTMIHPPTAVGMCLTWSPAFTGGLLTLLAVALAATRNGRRLIVEFPLRRMTTRRWMVALAVFGIEVWLINGAMSYLVRHPRSSLWPPILIYLASLHTLTFPPTFGRTRSAGAEKNSSEHNQCIILACDNSETNDAEHGRA
jgi:hypothetical protein